MPCYDPPAPYSNRKTGNEQKAAAMLCDFISKHVKEHPRIPLTAEMLRWWMEHRKIDIEALDYWKVNGSLSAESAEEKNKALLDISMAEELLKQI